VRVPVVDAATIIHEVDTTVPVALPIPHDLRVPDQVVRPVGDLGSDKLDRRLDWRRHPAIDRGVHWLVHDPIGPAIDDRSRFVDGSVVGGSLIGEARQGTGNHHQRCECNRSSSTHVHPFRCVPYRRDRAPGFDAVDRVSRRLASVVMQRAIVVLAVAVIGFGIYGVAVDSPFVSYYVPITIVLAVIVGWIHRTARFADSTLMALTLAAIGNLAGGVLLVGDGTLYGATVIGEIRYDKVFHALATGVAGWASFEAVKRWGIVGTGVAAFVAIMMAAGAGAFVEIIEYIGSEIFENTSVGDYGNNMLDLVANTAGSVVGVMLASRVVGRGPGAVSEPGPG